MLEDDTHRFLRRVAEPDARGCQAWLGTKTVGGYGVFYRTRGSRLYAHRVAFELANGPLMPGMVVCHTCDNPPCVNPAHLFAGRQRDNLADMRRKGRSGGQLGAGPANPNTRLTPEQVREIRAARARGDRQADVARRFGVRAQSIAAIESGKSWAWLE